ncbi:2-oxoacid:acceptor oxidoreductase family protein [Chloroflexota bacterium]
MQEVLWHGRGGQGVVIASSILGTALTIYEGKYAQSIPSFGGQRRDAPLTALTRVSESPIRRRDKNNDPDYIVILDDTLTSTAVASLNHDKPRHIIVNSKKSADELGLAEWQPLTIVDAAAIALDVIGRPITNTTMVGVVAAATGLAQLDSAKKAVADVIPPEIAAKNVAAAEEGYNNIKLPSRKG